MLVSRAGKLVDWLALVSVPVTLWRGGRAYDFETWNETDHDDELLVVYRERRVR